MENRFKNSQGLSRPKTDDGSSVSHLAVVFVLGFLFAGLVEGGALDGFFRAVGEILDWATGWTTWAYSKIFFVF
ncbi:MAG: hypothetical protein M1383_06020 [Patescibacteria group bacterium]|nr:hypothetical protein [Patescibacteria group bacterium]